MRTSTTYRSLSHADYIKLMQLLPRLKLDVERNGDEQGAKHTFETIRIVGKRAKAFIDEATTATDDGAASWAKSIVSKHDPRTCENSIPCADCERQK